MAVKGIVDIFVEEIEKRRAPRKHYVYVVYVTRSDGTAGVVYRQYCEFKKLQDALVKAFGKKNVNNTGYAIPEFPSGMTIGRNNVRKVAEKRLQPIEEFCKSIINLPAEVANSQIVLTFFAPTELDVKLTSKRQTTSERRRKSSMPLVSSPLPSESYVAVADYPKTSDCQLELKAGDSVEPLRKDSSGWWLVVSDRGNGWVPCSYIEKVDGLEEEPPIIYTSGNEAKYVVTNAYDPQFEDELKLERGQVIEVKEKTADGWWLVYIGGKEGRAPATNLSRADTHKARQALDKVWSSVDEEPFQVQSADIYKIVEPKKHTDYGCPRSSIKVHVFDDDGVDSDDLTSVWDNADFTIPIYSDSQVYGGSQDYHLRPLTPGIDSESVHQGSGKPPPRRHTVKRAVASRKLSEDLTEEEEGIVYTHKDYAYIDMSGGGSLYNPDGILPAKRDGPVYQSRSTFAAADSGETDLVDGELVPVVQKTGTGWWMVESQAGVGWVPSHFLRQVSRDTPRMEREADGDSDRNYGSDMFAPRLPQHEPEQTKASGHIANRFLNREGSQGETDDGHSSSFDEASSSLDRNSSIQSVDSKRSDPDGMGEPVYEVISSELSYEGPDGVRPAPGEETSENVVIRENSLYDPNRSRYIRKQPSKMPPKVAPKPGSSTGSARSKSSTSSDEYYLEAQQPTTNLDQEDSVFPAHSSLSVRDLRARFNKR